MLNKWRAIDIGANITLMSSDQEDKKNIVPGAVAIQGGPGSFHEQAARHLFGQDVDLSYEATFQDVFASIRNGSRPLALVAIANNAVGYIHEPYLYVTTHGGRDVWIVGETYVRVEHQLLVLPGTALGQITEVHSQAPALAQCERFLRETLPHATLVEEDDTAGSAALVAEWGSPHIAAIASAAAGTIHGLSAIAQDIQDDPDNITRFLVLSADATHTVGIANKTTCLLDTGQKPGALLAALEPFRDEQINISSLQSLFIPNSPFHMQFFIEFDAAVDEDRSSRVIRQLTEQGAALTVLGSYPNQRVPMSQ